YDTGDPNKNTTAPTDALANSGWQYEFNFRGFLGTPVAPHYFLSAAHLDGSNPPSLANTFTYNNVTYNTVAFSDGAHAKDFGDLRLYKVDNTFDSYASLYSPTDGLEFDNSIVTGDKGKSVVVIGRGRQRGSDITVGGNLKGWNWGLYDQVQRWGQNKV